MNELEEAVAAKIARFVDDMIRLVDAPGRVSLAEANPTARSIIALITSFHELGQNDVTAVASHAPQQSASLIQGSAPSGWRIVPEEPTEEMETAWADAEDYSDHPAEMYLSRRRYRAMLAAAPSNDAQRQDGLDTSPIEA